MGMDALTNAAFESLLKDVLPKLAKKLAEAGKIPAAKRTPPPELAFLLKEAHELLTLLGAWATPLDEIGDGDGLDVFASEGVDTLDAADVHVNTHKSVADALNDGGEMGDDEAMALLGGEPTGADAGDEVSDDEAMALLGGAPGADAGDAEMLAMAGGDDMGAAEAGDAEMLAMVGGDDMSAAEAGDAEMLAMVGGDDMSAAEAGDAEMVAMAGGDVGDGDMSDDDARRLLAEMDEPAPAAAPPGDMSDDEAYRLLADMDAPAAAPPKTSKPAAKTATPKPAAPAAKAVAPAKPAASAKAPAPGEEMSDDEARNLLAMMDAPAAPAAAADGEEMSDDEARNLLAMMDTPASAPAPVAEEVDTSADDEAMAMLRAMGGADDSEAPAPRAAAPAAAAQRHVVAHASSDHADDEDLQEIPERSDNDFANDPDMMKDFNSNIDDLMETLDSTILQLEQNPKDRETIESIFRAAHTLKGAAGMFGFKAIERVMHRMENLFDLVRKGTLIPDSNTIDVVFQGLDVLRALLDGVKEGKSTGTKTVPIVRALELAIKGQYVKGSVGGAKAAAAEPAAAGGGGGGGGGDDEGRPGAKGEKKKKKEEQSTIRVDLERLDHLVNLVGELVIDRTRFASIEEEIRTTSPQLGVAGNMSETVQLFGRHMNEIYENIMKIRMVQIGSAFNKFTRIVRDLSRSLGKEIELFIDGEETELDKTLVEQIGDPLIHLIRNSCDHGVEMPEARVASGKSAQGKIFLSARQEGNHIIITIEDDGKGINVDAVRKKGIERGLIAEDAMISDRDIINLIFEPGFSTAEKVTTVSGRGVGMDVVRKQISKLKGLIDIDSKLGHGTTTTIRLPLTLAIVQSLLVEVQGEVFAIPLSTVVESVRIKPEEIQKVGDAEVIKRHDKVLPLMHLQDALELSKKAELSWYSGHHRTAEAQTLATMRVAKRKDRLYVVIVGTGDRRFGIVVDQLLHQQEMVIKSMGPVMKNTPCVAGGAVLGNGEVVLVLDIPELEDTFRVKARPQAA